MRAAAFLLACGLGAVLPGCLGCEPHLDVRHCLPGASGCAPDGDPVIDWNATWAAAWPDVDALLHSTPEGRHAHATWDPAREAAWWQAVGVPAGEPEKEAYVRLGGALLRVRVLSCG